VEHFPFLPLLSIFIVNIVLLTKEVSKKTIVLALIFTLIIFVFNLVLACLNLNDAIALFKKIS
jgi:hypothetical protein